MAEQNGNLKFNSPEEYLKWQRKEEAKTLKDDEILGEYSYRFGGTPSIPMIICQGYNDPDYIAMLRNALIEDRPVTEEDYEKFFPMEDGADY